MASRAVPLLASPDLDETLAFYRRLGFESHGAPHSEWDYLMVRSDGIELHFVGPTAGRTVPGSCFVYVEDADVVYRDWKAGIAPPARLEAPINTNYGMRAFTLFDPHDNEVRVGSAPNLASAPPILPRG